MLFPLGQLLPVGQLALAQQIGHLQKGRLLGQLLDGVAAVAEDPLVAVDVGDGAAAGGGVHERRVVGHHPEVVVGHLDLAEIDGPDGALDDRQLVGLAGAIVGDGDAVLGHERLLASVVVDELHFNNRGVVRKQGRRRLARHCLI